jgi:hypothetical protein
MTLPSSARAEMTAQLSPSPSVKRTRRRAQQQQHGVLELRIRLGVCVQCRGGQLLARRGQRGRQRPRLVHCAPHLLDELLPLQAEPQPCVLPPPFVPFSFRVRWVNKWILGKIAALSGPNREPRSPTVESIG